MILVALLALALTVAYRRRWPPFGTPGRRPAAAPFALLAAAPTDDDLAALPPDRLAVALARAARRDAEATVAERIARGAQVAVYDTFTRPFEAPPPAARD